MNGVRARVDSVETLRDVIWANIRRSTIKRVSKSKKTGAGESGQLSEQDEA